MIINLLKYETDYLKSPFDKNKINKIYLDVINNISSKNNKNPEAINIHPPISGIE